MTTRLTISAGAIAFALTACQTVPNTPATPAGASSVTTVSIAPPNAYPETKRVDQVDDYHGVEVSDPYRWLEDDVRENPEVAAWIDAQNEVSSAYLAALPGRDAIEARLTVLWDYEKFGLPTQRGGRYFYRRNDGLQNQATLVVQDGLDGEPRELIDPNGWSDDGATALSGTWPSPLGQLLAYTVQDGGSDWRTAKVLDVNTGQTLSDSVEWIKFSGLSWAKDGSGFYYSRYPKPNEGEEFQNLNFNQKVYFHALGQSQDKDRLVYERPDSPDHGFSARVSDDGDWLVVTVWKGTDNRYEVVLIDLTDATRAPVELVTGFEHDYSYIDDHDGVFYFRTNKGAPKGRIVAVDAARAAAGEPVWRDVFAERDGTLSDVSLVGGKLIAEYILDAKTQVLKVDPESGASSEVPLPGVGVAGGFEGDPNDPESFFAFSSFNRPSTVYRFDVETGETDAFKAPDTPFDPSEIEVKQVFYASKDGTRVPMFIAHKKGVELNGANPTLLYGYGGFNIPILPSFSITRLAWMEMGGVYAVANLRGGGEYGKEWHDGGRLLNKQNTFDDFIAAGEHLVDTGWTSPDRLSILGGSNGGLLVGAVSNQRPDLFAAAIPAVGVMDMLRFNQFTAGRFWVDDYGDPANKADFENLHAYSPYHNLEAGADYPAILVTTADTDDRVVPGHSFKYTAALQATDTGDAPQLLRVETRAGHGAGKPTEKIIEEYADMWAFLAYHTGLAVPR